MIRTFLFPAFILLLSINVMITVTQYQFAQAAESGATPQKASTAESVQTSSESLPGATSLLKQESSQVLTDAKPTSTPSERERILPADTLDIVVHPFDDLSSKLEVDRRGNIFFSFLGEVSVKDLTADEAAHKLMTLLELKYLKNPHVIVKIIREKQRESSAMVLGAVKRPGTIPIGEEGMTLMQAINKAGGFTENAYIEKVELSRDFGNRDRVMILNLRDVVDGLEADSIIVEEGDLITVGRKETEKQQESSVLILGQVKRPGSYPILEEGMTFMEAIARAGGFTENAVLERISLTRDFGNRDREMLINARDIVDGIVEDSVYIERGDLVVVESTLNQIIVVGQVRSPQSLVLAPGMTFMRAIGEAGGFTPLASLNKVKIKRKIGNEVKVIDIKAKEVMDGKADDIGLMPGDVVIVPERVF
jgi:protein involved in polysaccharide export with SLBB domain